MSGIPNPNLSKLEAMTMPEGKQRDEAGTLDAQERNLMHPPLRTPLRDTVKSAFSAPPRPVMTRPLAPALSQSVTLTLSSNPTSLQQSFLAKPGVRIAPEISSCPTPLTMRHSGSLQSVAVPLSPGGAMASIIRGPHPIQQTPSTTAHIPFSSHVPRGPAAVASITPPRATLATPIVRPSHSQASSCGLQPMAGKAVHPQMQPRSTSLSGIRALSSAAAKVTSSVIASSSLPGEMLRSSTITSGMTTVQAASPLQRSSDPMNRPGLAHAGSIPKSVHIMQGLSQPLADKSCYKSPSSSSPLIVSTAANSSMAQAKQQPVPSSCHGLTQASPSKLTATTAGLPLMSHAVAPPVHAVGPSQISTPSAVQLAPMQTSVAAGSCMTSASKIITQSMHAVTSLAPLVQSSPSIPPAVTRTALGPHVTNSINPAIPRMNALPSIPVAKVHPQPLSVSTRSPMEPVETNYNTVNLLISPPHRASPSQTVPPPSMNAMPTSVVLMDAAQDRASGPSTGAYTLSTTYYCETYHQNAITVPQYGDGTAFPAAPPPTTAIRQGISPNFSTPVPTPLRPSSTPALSPMMVTVDPSRPLALHTGYTSSNEGSTTSTETLSTSSLAGNLYTVSTCISSGSAHSNDHGGAHVSTSSSPRPSILRKRTSEGSNVIIRKNILTVPSMSSSSSETSGSTQESGSSSVTTSSSSPSKPTDSLRENGVHSDCGEVGNASRTPGTLLTPKLEPPERKEAGMSLAASAVPEASPRKKPRKQQLTGNELLETHSTDAEDDFDKDSKEIPKKEFVRQDEDGVRWVTTRRRPNISLLSAYRHTWKSRHNHFLRYTDVKVKERTPTMNDLANQKGAMQKVNGWKIHHLCTQMDNVVDLENGVYARLTEFLKGFEQTYKTNGFNDDKDVNKVSELVKGNLQRCRIIHDQMKEARQQVLKMTDHKSRVVDVMGKFVSKRPIKRRDKN